MQNSANQVAQNRKLFEKVVVKAQRALKSNKLISAVGWAQIGADFALYNHPGFYTNITLESVLLEVSNRIDKQEDLRYFSQKINIRRPEENKKHVLHVMTAGFGSGGHSRLVSAWIKNTCESAINSIVTTDQLDPLPTDLTSSIIASGGAYWSLASFSLNPITRSLLLRQLGKNWADLIVLHIHPSDAIPILAFGIQDGPPVLILNHADHAFWLGTSIADSVANIRPSGQEITLNRRGIENSKILPIPILTYPAISKELARKKLNIKTDEIVLLTIGDQYKYTPFGGYDFIYTMERILKRKPNTVLFIIGPMQNKRWAEASTRVGGRIKVIGKIDWEKLHDFYASADIYVEGFPVGGVTAMLEAGVRGIPIIGVRIPEVPILNGSDDIAIKDFDLHAQSLEQLSLSLEYMIDKPSSCTQKAAHVKESIERIHFAPGWNSYLDAVISSLPSEHTPRLKEPPISAQNNTDFFWGSFCAEALKTKQQQFLLDLILVKHGRYASRTEWIARILKVLLRTNNMASLRNTFFVLKESAKGHL